MNGPEIVTLMLRADPAFAAAVPAKWIKADALPEGADVPNTLVTHVSWNRAPQLAREATRRVTERVQVTVKARDAQTRRDLLKMAVDACDLQVLQSQGDATAIAVTSTGSGAYFFDSDASIFIGSRDFFVSYDEPA